jgi:hypothetical protein
MALASLGVIENTRTPTQFKAYLDKYFAENEYQPSIDDWLAVHLTDEEKEIYVMLAKERLNSHEDFPVDFDVLWPALGYARKDVAKRSIDSFTLDIDYTSLHVVVARSHGGTIVEKIYLTLDAAQEFAMQSHGKNASKIAKFFVRTVKALQGYHILSLMYQKKITSSEATSQAYIKAASNKQVTYIGDVGIVNGKRMVKHGSTDDLSTRASRLSSQFGTFNVTGMFATPYHREVEKRFKQHKIFKDNQMNVTAKDGSTQTECFVWTDNMTVDKIMKIWQTINDELCTQQQQQWSHDERMSQMETDARKVEAEARKAEAEAQNRNSDVEIQKIQAEVEKHKNDAKIRIEEIQLQKLQIEMRMMELRMQGKCIIEEVKDEVPIVQPAIESTEEKEEATTEKEEVENTPLPIQPQPVEQQQNAQQQVFPNDLYQAFLTERCDNTPGIKCQAKDIIDAFVAWTQQQNIQPNINIHFGPQKSYGYDAKFYNEFMEFMIPIVGNWRYISKRPKIRGWYGISLKE